MMKKNKTFNQAILDILICPITREKLFYDKQNNLLINQSKTYSYPIIDNIPVLLVDEAIKL